MPHNIYYLLFLNKFLGMACKYTLNFEKQLKSVLHLESLSNIDQWNYSEDRNKSTYCEHLLFNKEARNANWKKTQNHQKLVISACRGMQIDPYLSSCTKLISKWIRDLNIIEENVGNSLELLSIGKDYLIWYHWH